MGKAYIAMRLVLAVIFLVILGHGAEAREGRQIAGVATHVRDGDTIEVDGVPVRLNGLHAPELREPGGREARAWMIQHTSGQRIVCHLNGERSYDRMIGVCENRDGDLAAQLIAAGLGRDCPRWSGGRYARLEAPTAAGMPLPAYCRRR